MMQDAARKKKREAHEKDGDFWGRDDHWVDPCLALAMGLTCHLNHLYHLFMSVLNPLIIKRFTTATFLRKIVEKQWDNKDKWWTTYPLASSWWEQGARWVTWIEKMLPSGKRFQNCGKVHHLEWKNSLFLCPFSIAMLTYQRVYFMASLSLYMYIYI